MSAEPRSTEATASPGADTKQPALSRQIKKAAIWSGINSFVLRLGQFCVGVATARLIEPKQFGIFAVALTIYTVIINVNELGVSAALARTKRPMREVAPTVATIALVSSATLTIAMFVAAPALSAMLGAPEATNAVRLLSLIVFLGGVTAVPYASLVRHFQQKKRFVADSSNFVTSTVLVIALAASGYGAIALALSRIAGQLVSAVVLLVTVTPRYRPGWNRRRAKEVLVYSLPLAGANVIEFTLSNIDYIVIGRLRGALPLGYYNLAYNISGWPVSVFGLMINEVALPAFARAQDDRKGLPRRTAGAFALTAAVAFPVSALCLALAGPLVTAVYGSRWSPAVSALAILGLFGSMRILMTLTNNILAAMGDSKGVLTLQIVWIAVLVPALIVGVSQYGIAGAAAAQELVSILVVLPLALWLLRRVGAGAPGTLLATLVRPTLAAAVAGGCAWVTALPLSSAWLQLVCGGLVGLGCYALLMGGWVRRLIAEARGQWDDPAHNVDPDASPERTVTMSGPASPVGRGHG